MVGRGIKHKKLINRALSLAMVLTLLPTQAFATDITIRPDVQLKVDQPGSGKSDAILSAEASSFNVTVPTILPITVDADGNTFTSKEAKIINSSSGPVKVNSLEVIPQNDWELVSYETDFRLSKIDTKEYGIQFNGVNIPTTGIADSLNWSTMAKDTELPILYDANISPQSNILNEIEIARVIFTIGWDEADLDFELNTPTLSLEKGNTGRIELIGVKEAKWGSDNEAIATVDQTGLVTAISWGTTDITAEANGITHRCEVTIPKVLTGITLNQTTATLDVGGTLQLTATPQYRGGIIWESSNNSVATVDQTGLVTSIGTGAVVITATAGEFSGKCDIEVTSGSSSGKYVLAKDSDFSGTANGTFRYIGTDDYVEIPHVIKGIPITSYYYMFNSSAVKGVKSTNANITNMVGMFVALANTDSLDLSQLDTSNVTDMSNMFTSCRATKIDLKNFNTSKVTSMIQMFNSCSATTIDVSNFNTSKVTNMEHMFTSCDATLNLSGINTSNVTNMDSMFNSYTGDELDLRSLNTSNVTSMRGMFVYCQAKAINVSGFNTGKVVDMRHMFADSQTEILDLSNFDTSNVTESVGMFRNVKTSIGYARTQSDADRFNASSEKPSTLKFVVKQIPVEGEIYTNGNYKYTYKKAESGWEVSIIDASKTSYIQPLEEINGTPVTSYYNLFFRYPNTTLTLEGAWTNKNVTNMKDVFSQSMVSTLDLSKFNTDTATSMARMFSDTRANTINVSNFNTGNVTDMSAMFEHCKLETLDLSNFNTYNVEHMNNMFSHCTITKLDIGDLNTSKVRFMQYMFSDSKIESVDLSNLDTSSVAIMYGMFSRFQTETLNLSNFDTSKVTDMKNMFTNCKATTLDISSFDTSNVTSMQGMFEGCEAITLDLSNFNTSKVTTMHGMFNNCKATTLDIGSFDTRNVTNMGNMFSYCSATTLDLSSFDTSNVTHMSNMFKNCQATIGYARTQADANKFNTSTNRPSALNFIVKPINKIVALEVV